LKAPKLYFLLLAPSQGMFITEMVINPNVSFRVACYYLHLTLRT